MSWQLPGPREERHITSLPASDAVGLQTRIGASSLTLGGLLKHLARAEEQLFSTKLSGAPLGAPWDTADWDTDPDWDFSSAASDTPEQLYVLWDSTVESYQQGVSVWGEPGMAALWGAATRKVIGAGIDDPRLARDLATLVGRHDVPVRSASYGDGRVSEQISLRRQDILQAADIRALPPGRALLLATGPPGPDPAPALVRRP